MPTQETLQTLADHPHPSFNSNSNDSFISNQQCLINHLPPELLSRIFEFGVVEYHTGYHLRRGKHNPFRRAHFYQKQANFHNTPRLSSNRFKPYFQVVVSHVCHRWRNIAASTSSLWTTIDLNVRNNMILYPSIGFVSTMLERSKGSQIDIYVRDYWGGYGYNSSKDTTIHLYQLLASHVHHWRTVVISASDLDHISAFLSAVSDPSILTAPHLQVLELGCQDSLLFKDPRTSQPFIPFGGSAPRLTSAVLSSVCFDWGQPWISSASNLVHLELADIPFPLGPSWTQLSTILCNASSLKQLSLRGSVPVGPEREEDESAEPTPNSQAVVDAPIQLLNLTHLTLISHTQSEAIEYFHRLHFPALTHLRLDLISGDYSELVRVLAGPATSILPSATQERSRCLLNGLDTLTIAGLACDTGLMSMFYRELRNLTQLYLAMVCTGLPWLEPLCSRLAQEDILLPRLSILYVSGVNVVRTCRLVVQNREEMGVPLDAMYVLKLADVPEEESRWFADHLKEFGYFSIRGETEWEWTH